MIRRPDRISRASESAASSILTIMSAGKFYTLTKLSVMAASFHVADCGSRAGPAAFGVSFFSASCRRFKLGDLAGSKEVGYERFVEFGDVATNPFERHGKVFDLFIHVVLQNHAKLPIRAGFGPLPIPIDGFELFHH